MTRTQIEAALRGTRSFDQAERLSQHMLQEFFRAMELLEPGAASLEYCWRFYNLGFLVGKED